MAVGTALLIGAGALKAGAGIASGIGTARAAKKMMLTDAEKAQLAELERRQAEGKLGLSESQRATMEQRFLAEQAGAQRELEAAALQQASARGLGGAVSGREVFLQEQAQASAERGMRQQQNVLLQQAEAEAAAAEKARIDAMRLQQKTAEAQRAQGIAQAVSLGLAGAGDVGMQTAMMRHQTELANIEAGASTTSTQDLSAQASSTGGVDEGFGTTSGRQRRRMGGF